MSGQNVGKILFLTTNNNYATINWVFTEYNGYQDGSFLSFSLQFFWKLSKRSGTLCLVSMYLVSDYQIRLDYQSTWDFDFTHNNL